MIYETKLIEIYILLQIFATLIYAGYCHKHSNVANIIFYIQKHDTITMDPYLLNEDEYQSLLF